MTRGFVCAEANVALEKYRQGYFAYYRPDGSPMTWESPAYRSVIHLDEVVRKRAFLLKSRLLQKAPAARTMTVHYNRDPLFLLKALSNPALKRNTWLQEEACRMYQSFLDSNRLFTAEAYQDGRFVGGVLCIDLDTVMAVETMITLESNSSKLCLYDLVDMLARRGWAALDCQSRHPDEHPLARIGETLIKRDAYLDLLKPGSGTDVQLRVRGQPRPRS